MDYDFVNSNQKLLSKKNIIILLILAILMAGIPVAVQVVQKQRALQSKATGDEITFPDIQQDASGNYVTKNPNIKIRLNSPFGRATPETP